MPRVVVVGRPNVGKSTLVNRLAERRGSIVSPISGLTRDRLDVIVDWRGRSFTVSDTGGLIESALAGHDSDTISGKVAAKAMEALREADLILFLIDVQVGITEDDLALVKRLRKEPAPILLVANKSDDLRLETQAAELWSLGMGEPMPVSALHGRGSGDLLDRIVELLPEGSEQELDSIPSIAIVGRPNVGKSSLFNRIAGEERAIVHPEPGTTRDTVDTIVEIEGKKFRFVDTAGIRRHAKTQGVEIFSASRTRDAIARADVAILVVDAAEGATSQDQRIAEQVAEGGVAAIVAMNKWDLVRTEDTAEEAERSMGDRLHFLSYAPLVRTSAATKRGMAKLLDRLEPVLQARSLRIPTAAFNEILAEAQQQLPPQRVQNRTVKILYGTQAGTGPPTFVLFASGRLAPQWLRFLEKKLRERFDFTGNPLKILVRERERRRHRAER